MNDYNNLVWIDLEMTGLDFTNDVIIEIATIVTDSQLNILAEGPSLAIYQPQAVLDKMGTWCQRQHSKSGLITRVQSSQVSVEDAEHKTLDFLKQYTKKGESPLCGNSICTDRRFISRYMPRLDRYLHYRHIDVSTIKELAMRWRPELYQEIDSKNTTHLALDDIRDSIEELRFYAQHFFK